MNFLRSEEAYENLKPQKCEECGRPNCPMGSSVCNACANIAEPFPLEDWAIPEWEERTTDRIRMGRR